MICPKNVNTVAKTDIHSTTTEEWLAGTSADIGRIVALTRSRDPNQ